MKLEGKVAVVTGANTGIGFCTVGELARRGATVVMACRNIERAKAAKQLLLSRYGTTNAEWMKIDVADPSVEASLTPIEDHQLIPEKLDLASLQSVRQFAHRILKAYSSIHLLINNAGQILSTYSRTKDGFEMTLGVNHLGHFLLTELMLPALKAAAPSRIIIVSSIAHKWGQLYKPDLQMTDQNYGYLRAYSSSKLINVMHAIELSKRLEGTNVTVLWHLRFLRPLSISAWEGTQTTLYTVLVEHPKPGGYYSNCALTSPKAIAHNEQERKFAWDRSCELVGLPKYSVL
ncbi:unnamed protein product [Echinostoma caproni]|uniref:Retinol dehydrogenase 12 n=1 Tax=Echinostoma caproni TaxID=27848 RepID=A0A183A6C4_9TREM|nr:unnamed protein product [Echinostoma caproni]